MVEPNLVLRRGFMTMLAGVALTPSLSVCSLSILWEQSLLLDVQVAAVAKEACYQFRQVYSPSCKCSWIRGILL